MDPLAQFNAACDALRGAGWNVVAVASRYGGPTPEFSVTLSLLDRGVAAQDHAVLDSLTAVTVGWHELRHGSPG